MNALQTENCCYLLAEELFVLKSMTLIYKYELILLVIQDLT